MSLGGGAVQHRPRRGSSLAIGQRLSIVRPGLSHLPMSANAKGPVPKASRQPSSRQLLKESASAPALKARGRRRRSQQLSERVELVEAMHSCSTPSLEALQRAAAFVGQSLGVGVGIGIEEDEDGADEEEALLRSAWALVNRSLFREKDRKAFCEHAADMDARCEDQEADIEKLAEELAGAAAERDELREEMRRTTLQLEETDRLQQRSAEENRKLQNMVGRLRRDAVNAFDETKAMEDSRDHERARFKRAVAQMADLEQRLDAAQRKQKCGKKIK